MADELGIVAGVRKLGPGHAKSDPTESAAMIGPLRSRVNLSKQDRGSSGPF